MKENICTDCGARQCTFRSYDRETCPRGLRPPQLLLKHFQIKEPAIDFDASKITRRLMAEVTDTTDAVIVTAIRKEAERQGFTDLYLIDRELVKNVITGATPRRGRWLIAIEKRRRYAPVSSDMLCSNCRAAVERIDGINYKYCPNCGAKMDGEEERKQ